MILFAKTCCFFSKFDPTAAPGTPLLTVVLHKLIILAQGAHVSLALFGRMSSNRWPIISLENWAAEVGVRDGDYQIKVGPRLKRWQSCDQIPHYGPLAALAHVFAGLLWADCSKLACLEKSACLSQSDALANRQLSWTSALSIQSAHGDCSESTSNRRHGMVKPLCYLWRSSALAAYRVGGMRRKPFPLGWVENRLARPPPPLLCTTFIG